MIKSTKLLKIYLHKYIYLAPIIMLLVTLYSNFFNINYVVAGNVIGYSLLTNITMFYFFNYKGNYCWFTRNIPIGLISINLFDIIGCFIDYETYSILFNLLVVFVTTLFYIMYKIKNIY